MENLEESRDLMSELEILRRQCETIRKLQSEMKPKAFFLRDEVMMLLLHILKFKFDCQETQILVPLNENPHYFK